MEDKYSDNLVLGLKIRQAELGVERDILLRNAKAFEDSDASHRLNALMDRSKVEISLSFMERAACMLSEVEDNIGVEKYPFVCCNDLNEVANIVEKEIKKAKDPCKIDRKKVLSNQFYNEELPQETSYIQ